MDTEARENQRTGQQTEPKRDDPGAAAFLNAFVHSPWLTFSIARSAAAIHAVS